MQAFFTWFDAFLSSGSFWVYIVIFFGKVLEVSLCTLRIVLINRGERVKGSLIAIIEITLWLIIASSVLDGWKNDIGKAISYALDELLAFGLSSLQIVVPTLEETKKLANYLQSQGYGVTSIDVKGKDANSHYMLIMMIKRKLLKSVMEEIQQTCPAAMITVSDVKTVRGGYMRNAKQRNSARK